MTTIRPTIDERIKAYHLAQKGPIEPPIILEEFIRPSLSHARVRRIDSDGKVLEGWEDTSLPRWSIDPPYQFRKLLGRNPMGRATFLWYDVKCQLSPDGRHYKVTAAPVKACYGQVGLDWLATGETFKLWDDAIPVEVANRMSV